MKAGETAASRKNAGAELAALDLSWVIPTYNEAPIIASSVREIQSWVARTGRRVEIVVVDDGTDDLEGELARAGLDGAVQYVVGRRLGKGAAIRDGVLRSRGELVAYCDADMPLSMEDVEACVHVLEREGASYVVPERPWTFHGPVRTAASVVLWAMQCAVVFQGHRFRDTQCGFKVFKGELARRLASEQVTDGGMFDIEYLYRATRLGEKLSKVRVVQRPEMRPSKIRVLRCLFVDPIDLVRIRIHAGRTRKG